MTARSEPGPRGKARAPLLSIPPGANLESVDLALEVVGVGIFECDPASGTHRFSDRCKTICGFAVEDTLTPELILSRVHPDDRGLAAQIWQVRPPGEPGRYSVEHRIVLPDGSTRWVLVSGHTARSDKAPHTLRGHGAMRDVTEHKLAEQQLYERTSQLRAFIEGAPVPIAIFDRSMRYLAFSRRYAEERQVVGVDLIGRSAYEVFEMQAHWKAAHARALQGATERCEQDLFVRADGTHEYTRWEVRPWYSADNEVGGIIVFIEFITKRVKAQQALRESQARLELAVRAGALGTFDYDMVDGNITWDCRTRELWGVGPDEKITPDIFRRALHPEDRERVERGLEEISRNGARGVLAEEYRIVNLADGSLHWIAATGRIYFEAQRPIRLVGVVQDITERKRTELALEESAEELRRADERKDLFLATLSHELRNPLAPIRTAAELLASPKLTAEQLRWVSQVVSRQTGHMASLLEDLLEITRISRGKLTLKKELVRLSGVVQSAIESARPLIAEKHHELIVSLPPEPVTLQADPLRLSQVLSNLLLNAAKFTDRDGRIELTAAVEGTCLVIRVKDNGIGIPRECLGKIFTMFWQGDGKTGHPHGGGLGIGLAFVEGVVRLHGGSIEARSRGTGCGTELVVRLPLSSEAPSDAGPLPTEAETS